MIPFIHLVQPSFARRTVPHCNCIFTPPRPSIRPSRLQRRHKATQQLRQGARRIPPPNNPQIPKQVQKIPKQVRAISQAGTTRFPTSDKVSPREGTPAAPGGGGASPPQHPSSYLLIWKCLSSSQRPVLARFPDIKPAYCAKRSSKNSTESNSWTLAL